MAELELLRFIIRVVGVVAFVITAIAVYLPGGKK
tara:strand:+ start:1371 stop:1472 length:102 start_codon:yes stop_codon:yes gene_type:complete